MPTILEKHVNHPNFKRIEEQSDRFIIYMNSIKVKKGEEIFYFNIDRSGIVANRTYSIVIKKKVKYQTSRIG